MSHYADFPSDLLEQIILLNTTEGPMEYTFNDLDSWRHQMITYGMFEGIRIGAAALTMILVLLLNKSKTVFFYLYLAGLSLILIESSLLLVGVYGDFSSFAVRLTFSYAAIDNHDVANSCAGSVTQVLIIIVAETCLLLQTNVLLQDMKNKYFRFAILAFCLIMAVIPTIFVWLFYAVVNCKGTVDPLYFAIMPEWPSNVASPLFSASIIMFAAINSTKLVIAIMRRRRMGLKQLDVYQVFFITTLQTMFIPAIFTIIDFATPATLPSGFSSLTSLLVIVFLPLSGVWARFKIFSPDIKSKFFAPVSSNQSTISSAQTITSANYGLRSPISAKKLEYISTSRSDNGEVSPTTNHDIDFEPQYYSYSVNKEHA